MCLAVPGKILNKKDENAVVDINGVRININIALIPDIRPGEYCIVHAGYAIEKVDDESLMEINNYFNELNAEINR